MSSITIPYLIRLASLIRGVGSLLDEADIISVGNGILDVAVLPDSQIIAVISREVISAQKITRVSSKGSKPRVFRKNYDYGELWPKILDDYRDGKIKTIVDFLKKKRSNSKKASTIGPIDSYCSSDRNVDYWKQLLDTSPSESVSDFIQYVKSVSCDGGDIT
jgi:hypothetical protein